MSTIKWYSEIKKNKNAQEFIKNRKLNNHKNKF